ncbi:acyltransferase [Ectobacillus ponti]|uniref:Acyltransferase n=1 Tax=Ectobacillus ponti TaxID=2961894 RepID=A0AA42BNE0_9BACI|nr:acyltransferase [Ectobacillus ponti]MCP8967346.1 acyltransferase [Ectobacillus ponti]
MKKERLIEIEILRGLAFLAVVFQHVMAGLFYKPEVGPFSIVAGTTFLGLTRFAVPLFVFISGVVLFYNYQHKVNYKAFLQKRFVQIFVPYFFWTVFYYAWVSFLSGFAASTLLQEIKKMAAFSFTGTASYHLWFIVMLIPFYFLFPLFQRLLSSQRGFRGNAIILAVAFVLNFGLVYALSKGMLNTPNPHFAFFVKYLDRNFIFWVFYFLLGGFAGLYYEKWKLFVRKAFLPSLVLLGVCVYIICSDIVAVMGSVMEDHYIRSAGITGPLQPFMMLTILLQLIVIFALAEKLTAFKSAATDMLHTFGKYSFGAYLTHAFVLHYTNNFVSFYLHSAHVFIQLFVSFVACSLLSLGACVLLSRTELSFGEVTVGKV